MASGGYTYKQMQNAVSLAVRRFAGDDGRFVTDMIPYFVNDAYHELDGELRWTRCTYDIDTVDGTAEYIVPSSVREYLHVQFVDAEGNYYTLEPLALAEYVKKLEGSTNENEPRYYAQHGDRLYLYPTPDADDETVKIYVVGEPPRLSADDDKPGFPVRLHQLVIQLAVARAMRHLGKYEDALQEEVYVKQQIVQQKKDAAMKRGGSGRVQHRGP